MTITWYGQACFRIETRETVIALDPPAKSAGFTPPRFSADLVLVSHSHPAHANAAAIGGSPRVLTNPGEYELKGITVRGIRSYHDPQEGRERGPNTIFRIEAEGIILVHLGDFGEAELREETAEAIGRADILCLPVGGGVTVDAEAAAELVRKMEPRLAIPMHYALSGLTATVERFLGAAGAKHAERLEKLVIKKKDLSEDGTRVVVLTTS